MKVRAFERYTPLIPFYDLDLKRRGGGKVLSISF